MDSQTGTAWERTPKQIIDTLERVSAPELSIVASTIAFIAAVGAIGPIVAHSPRINASPVRTLELLDRAAFCDGKQLIFRLQTVCHKRANLT